MEARGGDGPMLDARIRGRYLPLLVGAAAFALAFPPFPPLIGALIALTAFALALERGVSDHRGLGGALGMGALFGVIGYGPNILWIMAGFGGGGARMYLALGGALAVVTLSVVLTAGLFHLARVGNDTPLPTMLLLPLCWVAGEVVLAHMGDVAFPWLPVGLSVSSVPLLLQTADISGVHGVSAWIAALAGAIVDLSRRRTRPHRSRAIVAAAVALIALVLGYGSWRLGSVELEPALRVAVVQPDIRPEQKHDPALLDANVGRLTALTREAASLEPALVLWPETALAGMLDDHPDWRDSLQAAAVSVGAPILTGVVQRVPPGADGRIGLHNAAILTDSAGQLGAHPDYRKRMLVPITERIPFVDPAWFSSEYPPPLRGFTPGTMEEPLSVDGHGVGALICFESAFPALARQYRERGATLIANLTNDAVLGDGRGPAQHAAHVAVRAVEGRIAVIQAANSGVSVYADPRGVTHDPTPRDTAMVRVYEVTTTEATSMYVKLGDWLGWGSVIGAALLAATGMRARRTDR